MPKNIFIKLTLFILFSFGAFCSYAEDLSQQTDKFICTMIVNSANPSPAYFKEAENRQLNCSEIVNINKSLSEDGLIIDIANKPLITKCKTGYEKNNDSPGCTKIIINTPAEVKKITTTNKPKFTFNIILSIALLALVLLIIYVFKNPHLISKNRGSDSGDKSKNKPNPDQSDDKQTITTLRRDLSALMNSMNDLNQTFMTLKSSLDQKDKEIARYKSGYDATIYKNFLLRFTRVDKVIKEYISENKIDMNGLDDIQIQMDDALAECEVEVFSPEIGADYKTSTGLADKPKIIETSNEAKDGMVAEIIAPGYQRRLPNDEYEVIVTAKVAIHIFKK